MADLSKIQAVLTLDNDPFKKGLKKSNKDAEGLNKSLKAGLKGVTIAAGVVAAGFTAAVAGATKLTQKVFEVGAEIDETNKSARDLGLTFAELEGVRLTSAMSGVESIDNMLREVNRKMGEFLALGTGEVAAVFETLGLTAGDVRDVPLLQQIDMISERLEDMGLSSQEIQGIWQKIAGDGEQAARAFGTGANSLQAQADAMADIGTLTDEQAQAVENMNDAWARVGAQQSAAWKQLTAELSPAYEAMGVVVGDMFEAMNKAFGNDGQSLVGEFSEGLVFLFDNINRVLVPAMLRGLAGASEAYSTLAGSITGIQLSAAGAAELIGANEQAARFRAAARSSNEVSKRTAETAKNLEAAAMSMERMEFLGDRLGETGSNLGEDVAQGLREGLEKDLATKPVKVAAEVHEFGHNPFAQGILDALDAAMAPTTAVADPSTTLPGAFERGSVGASSRANQNRPINRLVDIAQKQLVNAEEEKAFLETISRSLEVNAPQITRI